MPSLHRHTRLTAIIAAILLTLSSSGFTAVLHICLMADQACCDPAMMARMEMNDYQASGSPVLKSNLACCAVTVAGGLNANPIVTGDQNSAPHQLDVLALIPLSAFCCTLHVPAHPILHSPSAASPPPSVEKYILNASFLI